MVTFAIYPLQHLKKILLLSYFPSTMQQWTNLFVEQIFIAVLQLLPLAPEKINETELTPYTSSHSIGQGRYKNT